MLIITHATHTSYITTRLVYGDSHFFKVDLQLSKLLQMILWIPQRNNGEDTFTTNTERTISNLRQYSQLSFESFPIRYIWVFLRIYIYTYQPRILLYVPNGSRWSKHTTNSCLWESPLPFIPFLLICNTAHHLDDICILFREKEIMQGNYPSHIISDSIVN